MVEVFALQLCDRQILPKLVGKVLQFPKHAGDEGNGRKAAESCQHWVAVSFVL